jgi:hypothetical protein
MARQRVALPDPEQVHQAHGGNAQGARGLDRRLFGPGRVGGDDQRRPQAADHAIENCARQEGLPAVLAIAPRRCLRAQPVFHLHVRQAQIGDGLVPRGGLQWKLRRQFLALVDRALVAGLEEVAKAQRPHARRSNLCRRGGQRQVDRLGDPQFPHPLRHRQQGLDVAAAVGNEQPGRQAGAGAATHHAVRPPSTTRLWPVT